MYIEMIDENTKEPIMTTAEIISEEQQNKIKKKSVWTFRDIVIPILIAMVLSFIFMLCFRLTKINGASMEPALDNGQTVFTCHLKINDIKVKDIVVVEGDKLDLPEKYIVKRVIGMPGDLVEIKDNKLFLNYAEVQEDHYIKEPMMTDDMSVQLADDEYFIMGDNRNNSTDSRVFGPVKAGYIFGTVMFAD